MKLKTVLRWLDGGFEVMGELFSARWRLERGAALDRRERAIRDRVLAEMRADPHCASYVARLELAASLDAQERADGDAALGFLTGAAGFVRGLNGEFEALHGAIVGNRKAASAPTEAA